MNKEKFKEIMITTLSSVPDNSIRAEVLKKELNNTGISFESALASANYFYNEMLKIYSGQESTVYRGKVIVTDEAFCFIDSLNVCYNHNSFKFYITSFENFGEVLALVSNTENTKSIKSFDSKLTDIQLEALYMALINEYIHSETTLEQFKAVFSAQPVESIKPIKWVLLNRQNMPHKTALRELLELLLNDTIHKDIVNACFTDAKGNKIELLKRQTLCSNYYSDLENIINEAKK